MWNWQASPTCKITPNAVWESAGDHLHFSSITTHEKSIFWWYICTLWNQNKISYKGTSFLFSYNFATPAFFASLPFFPISKRSNATPRSTPFITLFLGCVTCRVNFPLSTYSCLCWHFVWRFGSTCVGCPVICQKNSKFFWFGQGITMASQTQGIQQLLAAEKRAAEKVSEARKRKNRRLKQAKEEAQSEIEK